MLNQDNTTALTIAAADLESVTGGFLDPSGRVLPDQVQNPEVVRGIVGAQMGAKAAAEARGDISGANDWSRSVNFWTNAQKGSAFAR